MQTTATQNYDIHNYTKSSTAYAEAASLVHDLLTELRDGGPLVDCRKATWYEAEQMASLAIRLQELKDQFCK